MKLLHLTLFGGFEICDGDGRKIKIAESKAAFLLAFLALQGGTFLSRERLIGLLWSDREEAQARGSLRHALWAIRRALSGMESPLLVAEDDMVALDPACFEADTLRFEALLAEGSPKALEAAIALYRGEFLEGVRIRDQAFQVLVRGERDRLHERAVEACLRLLHHYSENEAEEEAAMMAKRLVAIDPLQEVGHRMLMAQQAAKGQLGLAVKQYESCRDALRQGLDVAPDAETKRLLARIRLESSDVTALITDSKEGGESRVSEMEVVPPQENPSIAVMPFVNLSNDSEQDYFSDGITEDIINALSRLRGFLVIARNSTLTYKEKTIDINQIKRELGVRYILEGSVRKSGDRLRIAAELVDAASGVQLWGQHYDRDLTDFFTLQDDISRSVTAAIEPKLVAIEGTRSQNRSPEDLSAWELLTRAMTYYGRMTTEDSEAAIAMLKQAVEKYPDYGPAHSMLAFALLVSGHVGWIPESHDFHYAAELAHRAARLDDEDPWAFLALGYLAFTERQTEEAVRQIMRALELNPNFATAYGYLGWSLVFDGQSEKAIRYFEQSLRMSPHDPLKAFSYSGTSVAHYHAHRYDNAIEWARKAMCERPGFALAQRILCASLAQAGKAAETRKAVRKLRELQPNVSIAWIEQYVPYTPRAMPHFLDGMRKAGLDFRADVPSDRHEEVK